ncbi:MAG: AfsR/SARP family transcriptional regulator, partial [Nonomuraea sp.]|nr:AfsR/SARP family transcriptional regulator [Nonomuraea sp.]
LGADRGGEPMDRLITAIRERSILLVLDNCEHLIEEAAAFADRLLGECRRLRIIATSREPLGIIGEVLWQVEPLALPAQDADAATVGSSPAVRLLRDRADLVRKDLGADPRTLAAMARICRALDGMPLAIELAAARLRTMSVEQLAARLDDRFRLLTGGSRTALPRHKTLRAVVDWSWDLLSEAERGVLRRLSVFSGGVSLEAAERVCGGDELVLDVLTALMDKSLLLDVGEGMPRYRMLNTIREYAAQRLEEAGETGSARRAHLDYVTELAEAADPHLRRAEQLEWLALLKPEHDNIGTALRWAISEGLAGEAMRLVGAVGWYWFLTGHRAEGIELGIAAVALEGEADDEVRALANGIVGLFMSSSPGRDQYQAQEWIQRAYHYAQVSGSTHQLLGFITPLERMVSDPTNFLPAFDELVSGADRWSRAQARLTRGRLRLTLGSDETYVDDDIQVALAEFRGLGERWGTSLALTFLADRLGTRAEFGRACEHYEEAITALTQLGATEDVIGLRARQAQWYWLLGDEAASADAMAEAREHQGGITWPDSLAELELVRAQLARWRGEREQALRHLAAVREALSGAEMIDFMRSRVLDLRAYLADDLEEARELRGQALGAAADTAYPPLIAEVLVGVADLAVRRGQDEQAVRLLAASDAVRGTRDLSLPDAARIAEQTRDRLGEGVFTEATESGRSGDWRELAEVTLAS